jgi:hypothetical protein
MAKISPFSISAKWSSNEELNIGGGKFSNSGPQSGPGQNQKPVWTPDSGVASPSLERRKNNDYKPVNFETNSLQRRQQEAQLRVRILN